MEIDVKELRELTIECLALVDTDCHRVFLPAQEMLVILGGDGDLCECEFCTAYRRWQALAKDEPGQAPGVGEG